MLVCLASSLSDTDTQTHTDAAWVSHVRVALCERKIPSGAGGSPAPPHPGMITRMGSRALDFLQHSWTHIHMVASAHTDIPECYRRLGEAIQP